MKRKQTTMRTCEFTNEKIIFFLKVQKNVSNYIITRSCPVKNQVTAPLSGQGNGFKFSTLTFEQRHVFHSGILYNNESEDDLLGKATKSNDISTVLSFKMAQLQ